ncbi:MAG: hypothetical protein KDE35_11485 [Geminicoccaceae bacterium]|nr:hypothetical protein [Geminicoccaceae bacterium]
MNIRFTAVVNAPLTSFFSRGTAPERIDIDVPIARDRPVAATSRRRERVVDRTPRHRVGGSVMIGAAS